MNSVDVFATVKIHRKHYRSCATHLCTSGTTSLKPLSNDWLVLWVGDGHTRWTPQAFILCKSLHFLFSITDWSLKLVSDTRSGLEPTIYRPQGEHTNHYTTDAVDWSLRFVGKIHFPSTSISWREHVTYQWDDDEVRFDLDQRAELDCYSASSLKQLSASRHVAPIGQIILLPSRPVFTLSP